MAMSQTCVYKVACISLSQYSGYLNDLYDEVATLNRILASHRLFGELRNASRGDRA